LTCIKSNLAKVAKYHLLDLGQIKSSFVVFGDLRMKKSLIALAALSAFATAAQAQSSVTISGALEAGYTSKDVLNKNSTTTNTSVKGITSGHVITPALNIAGTEDLGGGLKASFLLQEEFDTSTGNQDVTNSSGKFSQSFVSLAGGFGTVSVGTMNHATRDLGGVYRFFGDIGRLAAATNSANNLANTVQYVSPAFNGFAFSVASSDSGKTVATGADTAVNPQQNTSFGVTGTVGKLRLAAAREDVKLVGGADNANQPKQEMLSIGGSYDFGMVKLGAAMVDQEVTKIDGTNGGERKAYTINLAAPVTKAITLGASFANYEVTPAAGGAKPKADVMTLAAQYSLSKRTNVYGSYQQVKNNGTAKAMSGFKTNSINDGDASGSRGLGVIETTGATASGFGITVVHAF
jgi:predicted porin